MARGIFYQLLEQRAVIGGDDACRANARHFGMRAYRPSPGHRLAPLDGRGVDTSARSLRRPEQQSMREEGQYIGIEATLLAPMPVTKSAAMLLGLVRHAEFDQTVGKGLRAVI